MKKKIISIIGARPQFIKLAPLSRALSESIQSRHIIVHTGQHYDYNMSQSFFEDLSLPEPEYNLEVGSGRHGAQTGKMIEEIEKVLVNEKPDWVLVYGDTNTTLAGALAAVKLQIPVAHVEAGLRSYDMNMPEEVNRIIVDKISTLLFCPTSRAVENLKKEGSDLIGQKIVQTGDIMRDVADLYRDKGKLPSFSIPDKFILATVHRAENADDLQRLRSLFDAFSKINLEIPIVLLAHPRTAKNIREHNLKCSFKIYPPVSYLEMVWLLRHCGLVMTDSGGLQKEAFFFKKPCVVLRDRTEWVELVECGVNVLAGTDRAYVYSMYRKMVTGKFDFEHNFYGDCDAASRIIKELTG